MRDRRKSRPGISNNWAGGVRLQAINLVMIVAVIAAVVLALFGIHRMYDNYHQVREVTENHEICKGAAQDLMDASDYLTNQARSFTVTGDRKFLDNYFEETDESKRREKALASLEKLTPDSEALEHLRRAMEQSKALEEREFYSMRLVIEANGYDVSEFPKQVRRTKLTSLDSTFSPAEMMDRAQATMFDNAYQSEKDKISAGVEQCLNQLLQDVDAEQKESFTSMEHTMRMVVILIVLMLALFIVMALLIINLVVRPLYRNIDCIHNKMHLPMAGAYELQYMASVYNKIFDENQEHADLLAYEAVHDNLTGAYNRAGFEDHYRKADKDNIALILIDVDEFKGINDTYGHSIGDKILKRVVALIHECFRAEDYVCRIGGDEFAIIMLYTDSSMKKQIRDKILMINQQLQDPPGSLPKASLSVGVAIGDRPDPTDDMFKDADAALYAVKRAGRNGIAFYGEPGTGEE